MFEHAVIQYEISQIYLFTIVNISILSSGNIHRTFYRRKSRSNYGNTYHLYFSCIWRNHILLDSDICRRRKTRAVSWYNRISHPSCRMPNNDLTSFHLRMGNSQVFGSNSAVLHVFRERVREGRVKRGRKRLPVASYNNNQKSAG